MKHYKVVTRWAALFAGILAIGIVGCTEPPPPVEIPVTRIVNQEVEVTRVVTEQVRVEVPVTRIVEQPIEVPVTQIVEKEIEVTRLVIATPTPGPTPLATPTPKPTATPRPVPTPAATPTPKPDLSATLRAALWINIYDGEYSWFEVYANPAFDVDAFDLSVFVDGKEYCNPNRIYADDGDVELSCETDNRPHTAVSRVSVQTPRGDLRCEKHHTSERQRTVFACGWR